MRPNSIHTKAIHGLLAVLAVLLLPIQRAQAQSQPSQTANVSKRLITLKMKKASLFDAIAEIHKQAGLNFLVDGIPAKPAQIVEASGTLSQVLDAVSQEFGYFWTRSKTGAILLRKSFADPADIPQLNLLEWQHAAHDVKTILWGFPGPFDANQISGLRNNFYSALTAEQKRLLADGRSKGAAEMQWTDAQLTQVHQLCMAAKLSSRQRSWRAFDVLLAFLPTSYLEVEPLNPLAQAAGAPSGVGDLALNLYISGMSGDKGSVMLFKARNQTPGSPSQAGEAGKK
jgi:hypothetical protein